MSLSKAQLHKIFSAAAKKAHRTMKSPKYVAAKKKNRAAVVRFLESR